MLQRLNEIVPPRTILNALGRIDPFQSLTGPAVPTQPPDPRVLRQPGVRRAAPSVVRVLGTACGLGVEGSGWVVAPRLVVTAAHVVAGEEDTTVTPFSGRPLRARAVAYDTRNDIAILRVPGLTARPLRFVDPTLNAPVAIVGYPHDGPFDSVPGRIGTTANVLSDDSYGNGPVTRTVTSLSGDVEHGNSGGPAVDAAGRRAGDGLRGARERVGRLRRPGVDRPAGARVRPRPGLDRPLRPLAPRRTIPREG